MPWAFLQYVCSAAHRTIDGGGRRRGPLFYISPQIFSSVCAYRIRKGPLGKALVLLHPSRVGAGWIARTAQSEFEYAFFPAVSSSLDVKSPPIARCQPRRFWWMGMNQKSLELFFTKALGRNQGMMGWKPTREAFAT